MTDKDGPPPAVDEKVAVVVEDDADVRELIDLVLTQAGFRTVLADNGVTGLAAVREHQPVLTTVDVQMPGMDGFALTRAIREFSSTYLIMVTGLTGEQDLLEGFEAGVDDYLTKPFRPRELRARAASMLRRPRVRSEQVTGTAPGEGWGTVAAVPSDPEPSAALVHGPLVLVVDSHEVSLDGAPVELTRTEFDLLASLMASGRRVRSKADLSLTLRGHEYRQSYFVYDADKRALEVHVGNLRRKLGDSASAPRFIETVRGVGYRMTEA